MGIIQTEIFGRLLGIGADGQMVSHDSDITQIAADASITIGDEAANARTITIQLKKANGDDIEAVTHFWLAVFTSADATAFATTGGSTGVEIGTDGALLGVVAKKLFLCTSEADGDWDGTWTDTADETVALGVILPTGRMVMSEAFVNDA
jgi:hypothetical protein